MLFAWFGPDNCAVLKPRMPQGVDLATSDDSFWKERVQWSAVQCQGYSRDPRNRKPQWVLFNLCINKKTQDVVVLGLGKKAKIRACLSCANNAYYLESSFFSSISPMEVDISREGKNKQRHS